MRQFPRFTEHAKLAALLLTLAALCSGADNTSAGLEIVKSRCVGCHNATTAEGKLDLTSRESALRGGERGPAIVAGNARGSLVYQFASQQVRPFMPPTGERLTPSELKTIAGWIDAGAHWPTAPESLFTSVIRPLFEQKCVSCHHPGAGKASGQHTGAGPIINCYPALVTAIPNFPLATSGGVRIVAALMAFDSALYHSSALKARVAELRRFL